MLKEFFQAFFFIFVAEMGDKTQLLAMTCAAKYSAIQVLIGISIGVFLNHGLAIILGTYLSNIISLNILQAIAGFLFIIFGIWAFINGDDENNNTNCSKYGAILTVASAFFIGELGDKTQLTVLALSVDSIYPIFILLGTISGMLATGGIAIYIGRKLGKRISGITIQITSGIIFMIFGIIKVFESIKFFNNNTSRQAAFIFILASVALFLINRLYRRRKRRNGFN